MNIMIKINAMIQTNITVQILNIMIQLNTMVQKNKLWSW